MLTKHIVRRLLEAHKGMLQRPRQWSIDGAAKRRYYRLLNRLWGHTLICRDGWHRIAIDIGFCDDGCGGHICTACGDVIHLDEIDWAKTRRALRLPKPEDWEEVVIESLCKRAQALING